MIAHDDINERFVRLDTVPILMEARLGRWLVWPIVKERLWLLCRNQWHEDTRRTDFSTGLIRIRYGAGQIARAIALPKQAGTAILYKPRLVNIPTSGPVDPFLGDLQALEGNGPVFYYGFGLETGPRQAIDRVDLDFFGVGAVMAVMARFVRNSKAVRRLARLALPPITDAIPEVSIDQLEAVIIDELARFHCRRLFTRLVLRGSGCRSLIVLDPDGKTPEVAAAREMNIPVIEVQHGMFCNREPEYSWTAAHRKIADAMPVPDKVIVFGKLWKQQLVEAGFWRDSDVMEAENPVIASYRQLMQARPKRKVGAPLTVFYPSQQYVRPAALAFWNEFLTVLHTQGSTDIHLRLKLHPDERQHADAYESLFAGYPDLCTLVPDENDAFEEMLGADIVAGYSSLAMMEALGLGLPVVSLRGGAAEQGFVGIFGMSDLASVFFETDSGHTLAHRLMGQAGLEFLTEWGQKSRDSATLAYSLGAEPVGGLLQRTAVND